MQGPKAENHFMFDGLDDEAGLAWIYENEEHIRQLCACVTGGDPEEMERTICAEHGAFYGNFASTPLRHVQNLAIILTNNLKNAAVKGRVSHVSCSRMEARFIRAIEQCESIQAVHDLADQIKRTFCLRVYEENKPDVLDPAIQKALQYIADHCTQKLSLEEIASTVKRSKAYFSRKFHAETGMTVMQYIQKEKIHCAKNMLVQTDASIAEIAFFLSFSSQSYFQNVFRKIEGCTPAAYRQAKQ